MANPGHIDKDVVSSQKCNAISGLSTKKDSVQLNYWRVTQQLIFRSLADAASPGR